MKPIYKVGTVLEGQLDKNHKVWFYIRTVDTIRYTICTIGVKQDYVYGGYPYHILFEYQKNYAVSALSPEKFKCLAYTAHITEIIDHLEGVNA